MELDVNSILPEFSSFPKLVPTITILVPAFAVFGVMLAIIGEPEDADAEEDGEGVFLAVVVVGTGETDEEEGFTPILLYIVDSHPTHNKTPHNKTNVPNKKGNIILFLNIFIYSIKY